MMLSRLPYLRPHEATVISPVVGLTANFSDPNPRIEYSISPNEPGITNQINQFNGLYAKFAKKNTWIMGK